MEFILSQGKHFEEKSVNLAHKQVTSFSFYDPQQRIEDQINTFWSPLGHHFVCSLRQSIHAHLHVVRTRKYMSKNFVTYIH